MQRATSVQRACAGRQQRPFSGWGAGRARPPTASSAAAWQAARHEQAARLEQMARCSSGGAQQTAVLEAATQPEAASAAAAAPATAPSSVTALDIRIGQIRSVEKHPDADSLYVEQVDVGEPEPRTIVSGLVQFVPLEQMAERKVVVLCNLKPRNMRGIKSHGMLLCASNDAHDAVEPLSPPEGAAVGERVWFGAEQLQPAPAEPNRVQKKKLWEAAQPDLRTDGERVATFRGQPMHTSAGPVTAASLSGARIS